MTEPTYLKLMDAKIRRIFGDTVLAETLSAQRPTTAYEPQPWETDILDQRIQYYQGLGALGRTIYAPSRIATGKLVLSFESILRRSGYVAFPIKRDYWDGKISHKVPARFLRTLLDLDLLISRPIQIGKRPNVYDAAPEFLDTIPQRPEGQTEGRLIADRPWKPVVIKSLPEDQAATLPTSTEEEIAQATAEVLDLNQWYADNANRIEGVDDLRFHRVFHHNLEIGGRLYGQFTSMDRDLQRPNVRIDGEETAEADLNGSYLSFFLLLSGIENLPEDPYQHGRINEYHRDLVKAVMLRLFGRGAWWSNRFPNDLYPNPEFYGYPDGLPRYRDFRDAVIETYPCLDGFNWKRATLELERYESKALLNTLAWLRSQGEVGLPIHDGIRVKTAIIDAVKLQFLHNRMIACRP